MKLATAITAFSLLTLASAAPTGSPASPRALGDGTVNVARGARDEGRAHFHRHIDDPIFELVDESSHFSVSKRTLTPLERAVPIEHMNDPAVGKAVDDDAVKQWARAVAAAAIEDGVVEVLRRLAQQTGVKQCDKVNCPPA